MPRVACLFLLLFTALVARSTAADQNFSLTLFDLPPHGVYAKIRIEKTSDRIDAPNPPGVSAQVRRFAETVAPGRTLTIASSPPAGLPRNPSWTWRLCPSRWTAGRSVVRSATL